MSISYLLTEYVVYITYSAYFGTYLISYSWWIDHFINFCFPVALKYTTVQLNFGYSSNLYFDTVWIDWLSRKLIKLNQLLVELRHNLIIYLKLNQYKEWIRKYYSYILQKEKGDNNWIRQKYQRNYIFAFIKWIGDLSLMKLMTGVLNDRVKKL